MARSPRRPATRARADRRAATNPGRRAPGHPIRLARSSRSHRMNRDARIAAFLARAGYAEALIQPLAPDASFRRYLRLIGGPRPAVLMDAPPPEDIRPFLRVGNHLASIGIAVP